MVFQILLLIYRLLEIYSFIVIIGAVLSWLIAFGVINIQNDIARSIVRLIARVTEPAYNVIRKVVPPMGGLDLSPLILLIGIWIIQSAVLQPMMARALFY